MTSAGVRVLVATAAAAALLGTGCTAQMNGADGAASCAFVVTYQDRTYHDIGAVDVKVPVTNELGTATHPPCDDTGGSEEDAAEKSWTSTAYAVEGLDPAVAIAVGGSPDDAMLVAVDTGKELPAEVRRLIDRS